MQKHKLIIAVTGASGAIYAKILFDKLSQISNQIEQAGVVFSDNAKSIWEYEIGDKSYEKLPFNKFNRKDFNAPFASGSARYSTMIICPCSMGTMGRIANGISDDLITRAADVILKERRKLILVTRDTPLSLIHLDNMKTISLAGGIICPASPSFYTKPQTIEQLIATVIDRVLDLAGFEIQSNRWNENS
ncbi:MAG: UbiX family flavin prenyltransferase [Chlorobi bacterium]|nr:UbiX family flavin prenyltransferase [Chlorobiota bacterium]